MNGSIDPAWCKKKQADIKGRGKPQEKHWHGKRELSCGQTRHGNTHYKGGHSTTRTNEQTNAPQQENKRNKAHVHYSGMQGQSSKRHTTLTHPTHPTHPRTQTHKTNTVLVFSVVLVTHTYLQRKRHVKVTEPTRANRELPKNEHGLGFLALCSLGVRVARKASLSSPDATRVPADQTKAGSAAAAGAPVASHAYRGQEERRSRAAGGVCRQGERSQNRTTRKPFRNASGERVRSISSTPYK